MSTFKRLGVILIGSALQVSCSLPGDPQMQAKADELSPCEKVNKLLAAYGDQFNAVKGPLVSQRYMDVWKAKVNAIGSDCQIWRSGQHATYMCTRNAPAQEVGEVWFEQAVATAEQCLTGWQREDTASEAEGMHVVVWSQPGSAASVGVQVVPTRGEHRTVYYFVGDRDKWF